MLFPRIVGRDATALRPVSLVAALLVSRRPGRAVPLAVAAWPGVAPGAGRPPRVVSGCGRVPVALAVGRGIRRLRRGRIPIRLAGVRIGGSGPVGASPVIAGTVIAGTVVAPAVIAGAVVVPAVVAGAAVSRAGPVELDRRGGRRPGAARAGTVPPGPGPARPAAPARRQRELPERGHASGIAAARRLGLGQAERLRFLRHGSVAPFPARLAWPAGSLLRMPVNRPAGAQRECRAGQRVLIGASRRVDVSWPARLLARRLLAARLLGGRLLAGRLLARRLLAGRGRGAPGTRMRTRCGQEGRRMRSRRAVRGMDGLGGRVNRLDRGPVRRFRPWFRMGLWRPDPASVACRPVRWRDGGRRSVPRS